MIFILIKVVAAAIKNSKTFQRELSMMAPDRIAQCARSKSRTGRSWFDRSFKFERCLTGQYRSLTVNAQLRSSFEREHISGKITHSCNRSRFTPRMAKSQLTHGAL